MRDHSFYDTSILVLLLGSLRLVQWVGDQIKDWTGITEDVLYSTPTWDMLWVIPHTMWTREAINLVASTLRKPLFAMLNAMDERNRLSTITVCIVIMLDFKYPTFIKIKAEGRANDITTELD